MSEVAPGDRILFRNGERFFVARVDLVKERWVTGFAFDPVHRRWSRARSRIARTSVIDRLSTTTTTEHLVARIEQLRNQHEAQRQKAKRELEQNVRLLIGRAR